MRVAITGISGYLGQLVAELLDRDPAVDSILGLDVAPSKLRTAKLEFRNADVRATDFSRHLIGCDVLYHLAFLVVPPNNKIAMTAIEEINVGGSRKVFDAALTAGIKKIVYASSIAAYGAHPDNPIGLTEEDPIRPNPGWWYSRHKGDVERMLDQLEHAHPELTVIRLRPGIFLGPTVNNPMGRAFGAPIALAFSDDPVDLCWDGDVAAAFGLALHHHQSNAFNLAGGNPLTASEIGELLGRRVVRINGRWLVPGVRLANRLGLLGQGWVEWLEATTRGPVVVSADRARRVLGWQPQFDTGEVALEYVRTRPR